METQDKQNTGKRRKLEKRRGGEKSSKVKKLTFNRGYKGKKL
jgi:hypothetical protein